MADSISVTACSSSSELLSPSFGVQAELPEDQMFEGIAANVKHLLKLVQEQNQARNLESNDSNSQRVASMMRIIEEVKSNIQKSQAAGKKRQAELRRCNTDLRPNVPRDKKLQEPITDEKERLRKELSACMATRKSLEIICASVGREKEIIANELARKVQQLNGAEELVNDLKEQNEMLMGKLQAYAAEKKEKCKGPDQIQDVAAMQERNKQLSGLLVKSVDECRSLTKKLKAAREERDELCADMEELGSKVKAGLNWVHGFRLNAREMVLKKVEFENEISDLEHLLESCNRDISKHTR